jgi:hypothetical protein
MANLILEEYLFEQMKTGTLEEFFFNSSIRIETPWNPGFNLAKCIPRSGF